MIPTISTLAYVKLSTLLVDEELDGLAELSGAVTWGDALHTLVHGDHPMFDGIRETDPEYDAWFRDCVDHGVLIDLEV